MIPVPITRINDLISYDSDYYLVTDYNTSSHHPIPYSYHSSFSEKTIKSNISRATIIACKAIPQGLEVYFINS